MTPVTLEVAGSSPVAPVSLVRANQALLLSDELDGTRSIPKKTGPPRRLAQSALPERVVGQPALADPLNR
jgi:hypothetical protein